MGAIHRRSVGLFEQKPEVKIVLTIGRSAPLNLDPKLVNSALAQSRAVFWKAWIKGKGGILQTLT